MARRSQYQQQRTRWTDLLAKDCPRFGIDKTISLSQLKPGDLGQNEEFKISISVANERFVTPWVTVVDKDGKHFLFNIQFTFVYSGDDLYDMKWTTHYVLDQAPTEFMVHYHWVKKTEKDSTFGLNFLFLIGTMATMICASIVAYDSRHLIKTVTMPASPASSSAYSPSTPNPVYQDDPAMVVRASGIARSSYQYEGSTSGYDSPSGISYQPQQQQQQQYQQQQQPQAAVPGVQPLYQQQPVPVYHAPPAHAVKKE
eukprot:CAMPEP_0184373620 /NCGR_PEP_ID=MMETSP1089-20130417/164596_1 /TAXON_ID=38269 ORGANISM="Gloeochaete wittrockiana, Strain SAG46.84" /NCGR_SAMPLE_ID=MMETSP1089 /ASSEMBLY_ACC=CAM_ASM_000445 /LENGTH=255 /DNA_ID=CAMNT_0026716591 /DNA_START=207 /DNA_END=974 /DNA_ORIENTATION=-